MCRKLQKFILIVTTFFWATHGCCLRGSSMQPLSNHQTRDTEDSLRFSAINNFLAKRFPERDQPARESKNNLLAADGSSFLSRGSWTSYFIWSHPINADSESGTYSSGNKSDVIQSPENEFFAVLDGSSDEEVSSMNIDEISPAEDIYVVYDGANYAADYPYMSYGDSPESNYAQNVDDGRYATDGDYIIDKKDSDEREFVKMDKILGAFTNLFTVTLSSPDRETYYIDGGISLPQPSLCG